jgi:hypothetical protein
LLWAIKKVKDQAPVELRKGTTAHQALFIYVGPALKKRKKLPAQELDGPLGKLSCAGESGEIALSALGSGASFPMKVTYWRHADAPFGTVKMDNELDVAAGAFKMRSKMRHELTRIGKDAKSLIDEVALAKLKPAPLLPLERAPNAATKIADYAGTWRGDGASLMLRKDGTGMGTFVFGGTLTLAEVSITKKKDDFTLVFFSGTTRLEWRLALSEERDTLILQETSRKLQITMKRGK